MIGRKRPRVVPPGSQVNHERLCIRGIASAGINFPDKDVAALFAKVGLVASEVSHCPSKDVSFVTVCKRADPSSSSSSNDLTKAVELVDDVELRTAIERASRILQGSKWRGVILRSIELSKAEHYMARLQRTWDIIEQQKDEEKKAAQYSQQLEKFKPGEILYIKAPTGMGFYQVSSAPNSSYDGEGDPKEAIFSSTHIRFADSDDEVPGEKYNELSATSSDEESNDEEGHDESGKSITQATVLQKSFDDDQQEDGEVDWNAWLKYKDAEPKEKNNNEEESLSATSSEDVSEEERVFEEQQHAVPATAADERIVIPEPPAKVRRLSFYEEEWNESSDDDDDGDGDGLNLLQRLKGGGKRKPKGESRSTEIKDYEEEAWDDQDINASSIQAKKKKRKKKDIGNSNNDKNKSNNVEASSTKRPSKRSKVDPAELAKLQNKKRLESLAKKQKEQKRAAAAVTAALAAAPKSKKLTFSSSDEENESADDEYVHNINGNSASNVANNEKIVMFSDNDDDSVQQSSSDSDSDSDLANFKQKTPCPTSDEARFQLKKDYEGYGGNKLMKMQRLVGTDTRFKMDKDFMDDNDDSDDDVTEFEKFEVPTGPHIPVTLTNSNAAAIASNVDEEVDVALDALRSVLGSGRAGGGSARDVKDPLKKTKKQKRQDIKNASVGGARDFKNDMNRYDPENQKSVQKFDLDARKAAAEAATEETEGTGVAEAAVGAALGDNATSLSPLFHHEQNSSNGERVDPSKRYYVSKTNFWTDLYQTTKGRTDVVASKAASAEFRLTDLGLDERFGLEGSADNKRSDTANSSFSFGFGDEKEESDSSAAEAVDTKNENEVRSVGNTPATVAPTINLEFLPFVKEGSDQDARRWWEDNRIRLTDLYRKKHLDVLRGRRAKQRANTSSWK
jgi:ribosomal protein L21E